MPSFFEALLLTGFETLSGVLATRCGCSKYGITFLRAYSPPFQGGVGEAGGGCR